MRIPGGMKPLRKKKTIMEVIVKSTIAIIIMAAIAVLLIKVLFTYNIIGSKELVINKVDKIAIQNQFDDEGGF